MDRTFEGKRVLISGGAGVIGSELVKRLYQEKAIIFVGDLKPRPLEWPSDIIYRQGDLNYVTKDELISFDPEYFFHLAATFERTEETYDFWDENYHHNIKLTHHLMSIMRDCPKLKRVVFASSYLIYDPSQYLFKTPMSYSVRLSEDSRIYPRNLTGVSKLYNEQEIMFFANFEFTKFSPVLVRIFRVYGKNSNDVISRWIRAILNSECIYLYAKEGRFDYIFAGDVAEGLRIIALHDYKGVINLGTDSSRSVDEVIDILKNKLGDFIISEVSKDILYEASQANMDKFFSITGWKPQTTLEDGIQLVINYEIDKRNGKLSKF